MEAGTCVAVATLGAAKGLLAKLFNSISVLGSPTAGWVLLIVVAALFVKARQRDARLRDELAALEAKCSEHDRIRRQSAGKVAGSIGQLRGRVEELEGDLVEARVQEADNDLRVAQLVSQVDDLHRLNALVAVSKEELSASLRSQRSSLSRSRQEWQRSEEECRAATADRASALNELANERQASSSLRSEVQRLNRTFAEARAEFASRSAELKRQAQLALPAWKGNAEVERFAEALGRGKEGLDEVAVQRTAELLVLDMPRPSSDPVDRQRVQRQLLTCLHPDKWPSSRVATRLMQEVQRSPAWQNLCGPRGGA